MKTFNLFEKVGELKDKLKNWFTSRKKLRALENYSEVAPFKHKEYLKLIKKCMDEGFVGEKEADFLAHLIDRYEINFLDWAHRTKWLKEEMTRRIQKKEPFQHEQFELFKEFKPAEATAKSIPLHLLTQQGSQQRQLRQ